MTRWLALLTLLLVSLAVGAASAATPDDDSKARTVIHLLDYVGVDYPGAVRDGKVLDESEYQEQKEFVGQSVALLEQLAATPEKDAVLAKARTLAGRVSAKAPGAEVSSLSAQIRADVIRVWRLVVSPRQAPDLQLGATLFQVQCAACHGAEGRGDGPAAKGLDPAPSNFHDGARMQQRSIHGLFNTITLGLKGTAMASYGQLPDADRWALAFFVAGLRMEPAEVAQGKATWDGGAARAAFAGLKEVVTQAPVDVAARDASLARVQAYLTRHPEVLASAGRSPIAFAREQLAKAVEASRRGDQEGARQLAISAYLEGFELVESALDNVDAPLRQRVERQMMAVRSAISDARPADEVAAAARQATALLDQADEKLGGGELSPTAAFLSSLLILLREGLEAILVLAAIGAFVVKTGRRDALHYVHAGWMLAVVLGVATWFIATTLFSISGASRELTEGVTALLAAVMLLYVGWWLHARSYANAWQAFIREQVTAALGKRTLWALAGVSFLAVYRELFEIILFYETLWVQAGEGGRSAVLWGIVAAAALLGLVGAALLRYSVRLPIGPFFGFTSALLALLAVVFVGNGIAALQEAGWLSATSLHFGSVPVLGIHPTTQGLGWQVATLVLVGAGLAFNRKRARAA